MADADDPLINGKPISSLRVVDLKKECDRRNLSKSGSKSQLVERLKTQLLFENFDSKPVDGNVRAPNQKLQEEDIQNEFIKQYLEQQKQLIEMNSSSQESDHSCDESPKKQAPVQEPLKKQLATVEISPEKHSPENHATEKSTPDLPIKPLETDTPSEAETPKAAEEPEKTAKEETPEKVEPVTPETEMGRSRRRSSRIDESETKSSQKSEGRTRTRSSRSSGSADHEKAKENIKTSPDVVEERKEARIAHTGDNKENDKESMDTSEKEEKLKSPQKKEKSPERKIVKEADQEKEEAKKNDAKEEKKKETDIEVLKKQPSKAEPQKEAVEKVEERVLEKVKENVDNQADAQKEIKNVTKDDINKKDTSQEQKDKKENEKAEQRVDKKGEVAEETKEIKEMAKAEAKENEKKEDAEMKVQTARRNRDSSSRSRSRSVSPPFGSKRNVVRKQTDASPQKSRSSSSDSSDLDIREIGQPKRGHSSSSSSSRSRSRSPAQKKVKKSSSDTSRGRAFKPQARSSSSSSSASRSRSKSPPKAAAKKKGGRRSTSGSSSSRSRSPEIRKPVREQPKQAATAVKGKSEIRKSQGKENTKKMETVQPSAPPGRSNQKEEKMETDPPTKEKGSREGAGAAKVSKKISLNRKPKEETGTIEKMEEGEQKGQEEKPAKRRKWGSRSTSTTQKPKKISSMPISTESLKSLIPEIKPALKLAPEPIMDDEVDYEDDNVTGELTQPQETEDTRSVKIQRTVTQDVKDNPDSPTGSESDSEKEEVEKQESSEDEEEEEEDREQEEEKEEQQMDVDEQDDKQEDKEPGKKVKTEVKVDDSEKTVTKTVTVLKKEKKPEIKVIRRLDSQTSTLVKPDEPEKPRRSPSPARNPVSKLIHIRNLVRPFTLNQLKELLRRTGAIDEESFWIDKIKSHCFVMYESEEAAVSTRRALHNTRWPQSNPKTLMVDFASDDQLEYYRGDEKPIPPPEKKEKAALKEKEQKAEKERQQRLLEEKQKETERRAIAREKRIKERMEREARERPKPVREWDRDKRTREDWDRTMQRSKSRSPRRHRSRSRSLSKERRRRSGEKVESDKREKKKEKKDDEPPAKLLDDLFRKTKSTPCIYWLPLTAAQIAEKEKQGVKRPVLRQKQGGDLASPLRDPSSPESDRNVPRRPLARSPPPGRKSPDRTGRDRRPRNNSDSRSRGDRRR